MLNQDLLRRAMRDADVPDAPVQYHPSVGSTNAIAMELAHGGAPEWTLVAAGHQTAGRGRLGRRWVSEPGSSLLFSFVLRPRLDPGRAGILALLAGVAMADACRETGKHVRCKWPNDLLLDGMKVGGILTEASVAAGELQHIVMGVGMNLRAPPGDVPDAGGLDGVDDASLLAAFLAQFRRQYLDRAATLADDVVRRYRPSCTTIGRKVRARTISGHEVEGTAEDVDASGNLLVRWEGTLATVAFGDVENLSEGPPQPA